MHTIKTLIGKYSAWIWSVLSPLGAWGVFAIAGIDAAFFGMPLDPVVAGYVYHNPSLCWLYILMASAGSAAGSLVLYVIGYKGGEAFLEKKLGKERFMQIHAKFEQHEFLALMLPAMLPPPAPFKLFVLSAAVFEMRLRDFLFAIFIGRVVRFTILTILVLVFGPQILGWIATLVKENLPLAIGCLVAVIAIAVLLWMLVQKRKERRRFSNLETEQA